jgi:membrane protease YdiL (CAAX protease family)
MDTQKHQNHGKLFNSLNQSQASGGVYTLTALLSMLFSFVFVTALGALGLTEEGELQKQDWYLYAQFLISPLCIIVAAIVYFKKSTVRPKQIFCKCKAKYYVIAVLLQLGLFSLGELNGLFIGFLQKFGYEPSEISLPNVHGWGIVGVLLVVALLPALLEELFFRGMLLHGTRGAGTLFCVFISGALFSLYHQNPAQTVYQFICGVGFALVAYRSGSIFPTVLSHFLNNAAIIVMYRFGLEDYSTGFKIPFMIVCALSLIGATAWLILDKNKPEQAEKTDKKQFFLYALGGIVLCAVTWLASLVTGIL